MTRFRTIVADPPWRVKAGPYRSGYAEGWVNRGDGRSRDLPYPTMTVDQIASMPVNTLADTDAHLYLWTINRYLRSAFDIVERWGFRYSTTLVWAKTPMGGGLGGSYGISTEFIIYARRGVNSPGSGRVGRTWFNWKRPYDDRGKPRHSAKPHEFYEMVETVSPGPRAELFAREARSGWSVWGNEVRSDFSFGAVG